MIWRKEFLEARSLVNHDRGLLLFKTDPSQETVCLWYEDAWRLMGFLNGDQLRRFMVNEGCIKIDLNELRHFSDFLKPNPLLYEMKCGTDKKWHMERGFFWKENDGFHPLYDLKSPTIGDVFIENAAPSAPMVLVGQYADPSFGPVWRLIQEVTDGERFVYTHSLTTGANTKKFNYFVFANPDGNPAGDYDLRALRESDRLELEKDRDACPDRQSQTPLLELLQMDNWVTIYNNTENTEASRCWAMLKILLWETNRRDFQRSWPLQAEKYGVFLEELGKLAAMGNSKYLAELFMYLRGEIEEAIPDLNGPELNSLLTLLVKMRAPHEEIGTKINFKAVCKILVSYLRGSEIIEWQDRLQQHGLEPKNADWTKGVRLASANGAIVPDDLDALNKMAFVYFHRCHIEDAIVEAGLELGAFHRNRKAQPVAVAKRPARTVSSTPVANNATTFRRR